MDKQEFATVHIDGHSLLRVLLEYVGLNTGVCLGFRVSIENRRENEITEFQVRFFSVEQQRDVQRTYHDVNSFCHRLSSIMECDYQDNAWVHVRQD